MNMIKINNIQTDYRENTKLFDYIKEQKEFSGKKFLIVEENNSFYDIKTFEVKDNSNIILHDFYSEKGRDAYWHSTSHILAMAVKIYFLKNHSSEENVKLAIGPSIDSGFYYDFDLCGVELKEDNLREIENIMKDLIEENIPFVKSSMTREEILSKYNSSKEKYKIEIIEQYKDEKQFSIYTNISKKFNVEFFDMCRGPHIPSTGYIKSFKLLSLAGAYWRGDEKREMLARIYGISFPDKQMLKEYTDKIEEAKKRDHRILGKKLEIFSIFEETGSGLVYWHPHGGIIRDTIERFWKDEHINRGYDLVLTPHIARAELWKTSGHYDFYKENMYIFKIDEEEYVLKPMNCPGHVMIYKTKIHSYRDLPIKYAELGTVYRYERSGALHGLLRVRGFTQDDGHVFCTPEQLPEEVEKVYDFAIFMIKKFGYEKYSVELSMRDPKNPAKYAGTPEEWETAQNVLKNILIKKNIPYIEMPGEAVFYGPKIDIKLEDALGRKWQGPTVQFDFNLPRRFNVTYVGEDNKEHYVYMVHRALLGSLERFIGGLIEHYAGKFPLWLAPVQVTVLSVTDETVDYSKEICKILKDNKIRVTEDFRNEKIGYKIREAENNQTPFMLILGKKEKDERRLSLRKKGEGDIGSMSVEDFLKLFNDTLIN
ncbi:MAG: threonine--tRNA ligase [bacterium]